MVYFEVERFHPVSSSGITIQFEMVQLTLSEFLVILSSECPREKYSTRGGKPDENCHFMHVERIQPFVAGTRPPLRKKHRIS